MKKVLSFFVAICILLSHICSVFAYDKEYKDLLECEVKSMRQASAVDAYYIFCEAFSVNQQHRSFPEGYAGAYISEDYHLVIKVMDEHENLQLNIKHLLNGYPVTFEKGIVSCEELYAIADALYDSIKQRNMSSLQRIEVREKESLVCVGYNTQTITEEERTLYYEMSRMPYVMVYDSDPVATSSLIGGAKLYKTNGSYLTSHGTLGYCGTYNGQSVIVTAGHVSQGVALYFGYNNPVGTVLSENYYQNCYGDYSIIQIANTSTNPITNTIFTGANTTTSITSYYNGNPNALSGEQLFKYGISTGFTTGTVSGYNVTAHYEINVHGLISFYNSTISIVAPGDSGGPVYRVLSNGTRQAVGLISGGDDGYHTAFMTPFWYVTGFVPKTN